MSIIRDKIEQDYIAISATSSGSTLSGAELQNAIIYAKRELEKTPEDPKLKAWLTIIAQKEFNNAQIQEQLESLRTFVNKKGDRIIPAPVFYPADVGDTVVGALGPSTEIQNGVQEVKEALVAINPENLEQAIAISEKFINLVPFPETKATLRGIHGALIFDIFRSHGHNIIIKNGQVEIMPKPGTDVVNLQEKLQTLVNTGRISQDTLKIGMLYSSPTFKQYTEVKKAKDANGRDIIDPKASSQDFITYVKDLEKTGSKSGDIQTILESQTMLSGINMPQAIKGFQDMGQIGTWIERNEAIAKKSAATGALANDAPAFVASVPPEPNNTLTGKAFKDGVTGGHVTGIVGDSSKGLVNGIGDILSLGKGDPIATLGIGAALFYGVYKSFQKFGFLGGLGALFGIGAMNNIEKIMGRFGVDVGHVATQAKTAAEEAAEKAKKLAEEAATNAKKLAGVESNDKPAETSTLTPSQQGLRNKIMSNTALSADIDKLATIQGSKYPGKLDDYLKFIETDLKDIPLSKLFPSDHKESIFFDTFTTPLPSKSELSAKMLKRVLREYLTGSSTLSGNGDKAGEVEKDKFIKDHNITPADIQNKKLSEILESVHKVRTGGLVAVPSTTPAQTTPVTPAASAVQAQTAPTTQKNSFKIGGVDKVPGNNVETSVNAPTFDASGNPYKNTATKLKTDSAGVVFIPTGGVVKLGSSVIQRNNIEHIEVEYAGEKVYVASSHLKP